MERQQLINTLSQHRPVLVERFGVTHLALFGSAARGTARPESDVDVLVDFDGPASSDAYFGVLFYLEDLLRCPIDLVTQRALRPRFRPYVERDAIVIT